MKRYLLILAGLAFVLGTATTGCDKKEEKPAAEGKAGDDKKEEDKKKDEPKADDKKEEPKADKKEEPKADDKEEPAGDDKEEPAGEDDKEEPAGDDKEEPAGDDSADSDMPKDCQQVVKCCEELIKQVPAMKQSCETMKKGFDQAMKVPAAARAQVVSQLEKSCKTAMDTYAKMPNAPGACKGE